MIASKLDVLFFRSWIIINRGLLDYEESLILFFFLSGSPPDSIRTSLTLSRGQSTVRAGGFATTLSHAKMKKSAGHPTRHMEALPLWSAVHFASINLFFFLLLEKERSPLSESVTDLRDGTIMIFWQVGRWSPTPPPPPPSPPSLFRPLHFPNCTTWPAPLYF